MKERTCLCIDLKSFYASVECRDRSLDPLDTLLVVADESRTEKTICLAVSPGLKAFGLPGRPRLFEVVQTIQNVNDERTKNGSGGASHFGKELAAHPDWRVEYLIAKPRMSLYMEYSVRIFDIYRRFVSDEDIHVYSIDEVFIELTPYLETYQCGARDLAMRMIREVLRETGITATAGIGTNLYLAKIAMDILAKKMPSDRDGVRIAELNEISYRESLWTHRPLKDFWRVGSGTARRLEEYGMYTMGDIARASIGRPGDLLNEDLLYSLFGINAELLIDHAWGWEPAAISDIKAYVPESRSISMGQVLSSPYTHDRAAVVVREMADQLALSLVEKGVMTDQVTLYICYDSESLSGGDYTGSIEPDYYGKNVPKPAHGCQNLSRMTSSSRLIVEAVMSIFRQTVSEKLLIRRISLSANHLGTRERTRLAPRQLDLFTDYSAEKKEEEAENAFLEREKKRQKAIVEIRKKFGKNAILMGMNLEDGATAIQRNGQIGGHKA